MTADGAKRLLVVANETVGGPPLIEAVRKRADAGPVHVKVICPQNQPRHGYVVHDDAVYSAAENRLGRTLSQLRDIGIEAEGDVVDPDPYSAIMDEIAYEDYDELIVSTFPETRSGWLRKELVERLREDADLPVEHIVVELTPDDAVTTVLVVANQTVGGEPLIRDLEQRAQRGAHHFIVICPKSEDPTHAEERLQHTLARLRDEGLDAEGQVGHPDPYTAIQNALQAYPVDEVIISTFPETRSGWMRGDLIERVRSSTLVPVEHVVVTEEEAREGASA